jgi:hypothetical protein
MAQTPKEKMEQYSEYTSEKIKLTITSPRRFAKTANCLFAIAKFSFY